MMDQGVLRDALRHLCGDLTFLEAFDRTGRVLNIVVTRSDGRAPPLLCNYLTTPQMVVYSASLASCSIPGVYDAVELMAKDRHGALVPYFKTGGHRWLDGGAGSQLTWKVAPLHATWTDGGLQADLPKQGLTELFNVNQFIVSQVNPVAPLVVPAPAPPLVTETLLCLKHQLLGALSGLSQFASGHLIRPFGFRVADMFLQEYEGTVTIYPRWSVLELLSFLSNFTVSRVEAYILDGERATWPHLELIRSLTDIEYTLDAVAAELQCVVHGKLMRQHSRSSYGGSSAQLAEMGNSRPSRANSNADEQPADAASSTPRKMVGVASHASLFALGSSLDLAGGGDEPPASVGFSL
ncbi:hypothetical protein EMIHUDRAFT_459761 [Emiliania huxleyi CCMP1516]|uniref:PNPLA domain-containing protein n=2 Tax=Emiliania huxleyi TaxID=2903 RepID=A0A0D3IJR2_EMIH1|nr:hypothetical protein EMIHUDRAFT_459761 [Emiliania huxleyi CCMP1516]EOD11497.1 hypothetical protein EMIHUDRAFT_459761 [Emiliania huxleyi CCMP1516]|eukprot:XP_005763926.1 hypothetical protein EMIHUDRAFT_459761 [Emiliania huxleyi CCMP1516]